MIMHNYTKFPTFCLT